jgi:spore maturation protein B
MKYILAVSVPLIFLLSFLYAAIKKVRVYDSFTSGVKSAIPLIVSLFPYIATVMMLSQVFEASGLKDRFAQLLSPILGFFGIPSEIVPLLLVKPLSGSGSIAVLSNILSTYGVDSYIARCACVAYGSSETIFYIGAVYFAGLKRKKLSLAMGIALFSYFLSIVLCCCLCRFM